LALTRGGRIAYAAGLILGMLAVLGAQSGSLTEPPDTSILKIPVTGARSKPPVKFSHRLHEARRVACTQCHHEYQGRRNVWHKGQPVQQCRACHRLRPEARRPGLKSAYHRQCKGCHLRLKQRRRQAGPLKCKGCHRPSKFGDLETGPGAEGSGSLGRSPDNAVMAAGERGTLQDEGL
jgi:hypothetical protein